MGTRRGRGEGSIRRRASDGRWEAVGTVGGQRKSYYGKTRSEAREKLAQARREAERGLLVGDARQTVAAYLDSWLEMKQPPELKATTWRSYNGRLRRHVYPVIGSVRLGQVTPQHIQQVLSKCTARGLSSSTTSEVYVVLREALKSAVRLGLVAQNVTDRIDRPRRSTREMQPLAREEAQRLLASADERQSALEAKSAKAHSGRLPWLSPLLHLALTTGMRQGELLALRWRDVDLDAGRLSVVATMRWYGCAPQYTEPKTRRSRRQIALAPEVIARLRELRQQQRLQRIAVGSVAWQGERFNAVFSDELGFPLRDCRVRSQFALTLRAAGLERHRFHDLRHTCATLLLQQRVNPKIVSELLGHSTVSITLDLYSHVMPDMQDEATRAMSAAFGW